MLVRLQQVQVKMYILLVAKDANGNSSYYTTADLAGTNDTYDLAITQTHHKDESKRPIIHEFSFEEFKKNPSVLYD